ncbi:hypothetical protein MLD38_011918 [Melastoma candidum]|uniref:Uncharacterized protein n=1 Tax=Melastoma candidum TaxID=119954 RepID=A0ACB9R408_9MYRT|nr:hypothetical protein MLD38_011918 [Melastoma candidum]
MEAESPAKRGVDLVKPLRCIVKLGGAAITCKNELEKIHEANLQTIASQLREAMSANPSSRKKLGMDWSKRLGADDSEVCVNVDDFISQESLGHSSFVVVHGAGSFGHFQASKSGVHKGGLTLPLVKAGFVATRVSVTSLNLEVVRALAREGLPSIGMSPFSCGWSTCERKISSANLASVIKALDSGFVPVLHGDAVIDDSLGCTILSGDVIIRHLADHLRPNYVVFLTDVLGVYDHPPSEPDAVLLREIAVSKDGSWSVVKPLPGDASEHVEITVAAHDTTGGMATKIAEAAVIAKTGIDVYIVKAATDHAVRALRGEIRGALPEDWLGTAIRFSG